MTTTTASELISRQVQGLNKGNIDDVVSIYADDARFTLVSPHTLPGSELRLEGREKIQRHMQRVLDGGVDGVDLEWVAQGERFLVWRDSGTFGNGVRFSESHSAVLNDDGLVSEHWIHSIYGRAPKAE